MLEYLQKVQKSLKSYFSYFKTDDILVISEDKSVLPFAYLVHDKTTPNNLLLSIAVDYPTSISVAEITIIMSDIFPVKLTNPFYISSSDGNTYFGEEAYSRWELETTNLSSIEPVSKELH